MAARAARDTVSQREAFYDVPQHFYDAKQSAQAVCLQNQWPIEILRVGMYSGKRKLVSVAGGESIRYGTFLLNACMHIHLIDRENRHYKFYLKIFLVNLVFSV